jgi:hypothetical protein
MFYANIWDPALILSQIVLLQCLFYLFVGAWLLLFSLLFGTRLSMHAILAPEQLQMFQGSGWPSIGAFLLVAPILSVTAAATCTRWASNGLMQSRYGPFHLSLIFHLRLSVACFSGYLLLRVVGRAKQCLDFTATLYLVHFCLCTMYQGTIPWNWEWWGVNSVGQWAHDRASHMQEGCELTDQLGLRLTLMLVTLAPLSLPSSRAV